MAPPEKIDSDPALVRFYRPDDPYNEGRPLNECKGGGLHPDGGCYKLIEPSGPELNQILNRRGTPTDINLINAALLQKFKYDHFVQIEKDDDGRYYYFLRWRNGSGKNPVVRLFEHRGDSLPKDVDGMLAFDIPAGKEVHLKHKNEAAGGDATDAPAQLQVVLEDKKGPGPRQAACLRYYSAIMKAS